MHTAGFCLQCSTIIIWLCVGGGHSKLLRDTVYRCWNHKFMAHKALALACMACMTPILETRECKKPCVLPWHCNFDRPSSSDRTWLCHQTDCTILFIKQLYTAAASAIAAAHATPWGRVSSLVHSFSITIIDTALHQRHVVITTTLLINIIARQTHCVMWHHVRRHAIGCVVTLFAVTLSGYPILIVRTQPPSGTSLIE